MHGVFGGESLPDHLAGHVGSEHELQAAGPVRLLGQHLLRLARPRHAACTLEHITTLGYVVSGRPDGSAGVSAAVGTSAAPVGWLPRLGTATGDVSMRETASPRRCGRRTRALTAGDASWLITCAGRSGSSGTARAASNGRPARHGGDRTRQPMHPDALHHSTRSGVGHHGERQDLRQPDDVEPMR